MSDKIIMYGTPVCPAVPPARTLLNQVGADYDYVNIHNDLTARERVREINHGNESVPTFEFPDGSTLTEPSHEDLKRKLNNLGYHVPAWTWVLTNWYVILIGLGVLWALLSALGVL